MIYLVPVAHSEPDGVAPLVKDEGAQRRILINETLGGRDGQLRRVVVFGHHVNHQLRLCSPPVKVSLLQRG